VNKLIAAGCALLPAALALAAAGGARAGDDPVVSDLIAPPQMPAPAIWGSAADEDQAFSIYVDTDSETMSFMPLARRARLYVSLKPEVDILRFRGALFMERFELKETGWAIGGAYPLGPDADLRAQYADQPKLGDLEPGGYAVSLTYVRKF
jgi:hypothetical protein